MLKEEPTRGRDVRSEGKRGVKDHWEVWGFHHYVHEGVTDIDGEGWACSWTGQLRQDMQAEMSG